MSSDRTHASSRPSIFATLLLSLALSSHLTSATCYWPTGNETYGRDETEHQPCSNDTTSPLHTICCALNRSNPSGGNKIHGRTSDECLPNGICRNRVLDHGTMEVSYWRETCTEQDWKSGLCLDVCADDWTSGNGTTGAVMTPCDGTAESLNWCCGVDTTCCNNPDKVKTLPFEFRGAIPNTAAASSAPWPTSTSGSSGDDNNDDSGELSTGAKAGIGVGAGVGGLALIGLGFLLARRSLTKNRRSGFGGQQGAMEKEQPYPYSPPPPPPEKTVYQHELDSSGTRAELGYSPYNPGLAAQKHDSAELPS